MLEKAGTQQWPEKQDDSFNWKAQWYPLAIVRDLDEKAPNTFTLLNEALVIWKDGSGSWRVFHDSCPHRLVPLSEGRITEAGELQCAYHGWEFDGAGTCTAIPQGGQVNNPRTHATAYPCAVKQGLLWVKPSVVHGAAQHGMIEAEIDTADIPIVPELEEEGGWENVSSLDSFRDLPYDYSTLLENLLDVGHVPFTHHASMSNRNTSSVIELKVLDRSPTGFTGAWEAGPRQGKLGRQTTLFKAPGLMRHTIDAWESKGFCNITCAYAVPTTPGHCRAIVRQVFRFKNSFVAKVMKAVPEFGSHIGNNTILEDDVIFLHKQEPESVAAGLANKPIGQVYHMPGASDAYVSAFRTWLARSGGGGPFGPMDEEWLQAAGPRLSREQLLDRYFSHTINCKICRRALTRVQWARSACKALAAVAAVAAATVAVAALAGPGDVAALHATTSSGGGPWASVRQTVGGAILRAFLAVIPAGEPSLLMALAAGLLVLALAATAGQHALRRLESKFITGTYPPPRNLEP
ncbi:hypothetical protein WJX72_001174 [[Myrmecia] bisecta]|uniref:Rieske domain-containing protein n=1 Tax=[Myrmecia] bisecta TaxID=41462 RepID=A0AAW1PW12_9CHLO